MESRIISVAKQLFIEKGFVETSMSEIAAQVGINRPGLHYYFRTKDKMFQAVFGQIVLSFLPEIKDIITKKEQPLSQRVEHIVDAYYDRIFKENPCLPLFMIKEINRDVNHLIVTIKSLQLDTYVLTIAASLQEEMNTNKLKKVPLKAVFLTFYSLLITPCLSKNLISSGFLRPDESFDDILHRWKPYIIQQMLALLTPESPHSDKLSH